MISSGRRAGTKEKDRATILGQDSYLCSLEICFLGVLGA